MTMRDDRPPRTRVEFDEYNNAEEMEVALTFQEAVVVTHDDDPCPNLSNVQDVEPWMRIRRGDDLYVSIGVTVIQDEDEA
jgi:hypothetical protein